MDYLLEIKNLSVTYRRGDSSAQILRNVSICVHPGEVIGIVGESGSGKSTIALGILGLLPMLGGDVRGELSFNNRKLTYLSEREMQSLRGKDISIIFQNPGTTFDPLYSIKKQFEEFLRAHGYKTSKEINLCILRALRDAQLPSDSAFQSLYPHQLSGGMQQRLAIAVAIALYPKLLIADEPTSSLDVTTQTEIVNLLKRLHDTQGMSLVFISHDLALVSQICDRVYILKDGVVIESGDTETIFLKPQHAYTKSLIAAIPRIKFRIDNH